MDTGKESASVDPPAVLSAAALRGDAKQIAAAGADGTIYLIKPEAADEKSRLKTIKGDGNAITRVNYSRDGSLLFVATENGMVRGIASEDGAQRFATPASGAAIRVLALSPDGAILAGAGEDKTVHFWSTAGAPLAKPMIKPLPGSVLSIAFSADGSRLVACTSGSATVLDVEQGTTRETIPGPTSAYLLSADPRDGARDSKEKDEVLIGESSDHQAIEAWPLPTIKTLPASTTGISSLAASPSVSTQFVSGGADGTVKLWDLANGAVARQWELGGPVAAVAIRSDGKRVAGAGSGKFGESGASKTGASRSWCEPIARPFSQCRMQSGNWRLRPARRRTGERSWRMRIAEKCPRPNRSSA